ncbi:toll/interleukin-1 receptor domain-containing protein, partial [Dolichospermum sp. ST_sed3]|nr:toll/interleukin-1 receptor domain-containing protein [Dolichospermum sp. ST_sed3]
MVIFKVEERDLSETDQLVLRNFYFSHGISDPQIKTNQQVLERSLNIIGRTDWLDGKEILSDEACNKLAAWANSYENHWHRHEDPSYLQNLELPQFGESLDSLGSVIERLFLVFNRHQKYVKQHTVLLNQALSWSRNHRSPRDLLVGKEREESERWLLLDFKDGEQPPCIPPLLLCEFISESKRNALNLFSDVFICHSSQDIAWTHQISAALFRQAITIWQREKDVQGGMSAIGAIQNGIIQANTILFLVSSASIHEMQCLQELQFAANYDKRIIPVFCEKVNVDDLPDVLKNMQLIDFYGNSIKATGQLLATLAKDHDYFYKYTVFLAAALKWQGQNKNQGLLLRGFNLENAELWLTQGQQRIDYKPIALHHSFI